MSKDRLGLGERCRRCRGSCTCLSRTAAGACEVKSFVTIGDTATRVSGIPSARVLEIAPLAREGLAATQGRQRGTTYEEKRECRLVKKEIAA